MTVIHLMSMPAPAATWAGERSTGSLKPSRKTPLTEGRRSPDLICPSPQNRPDNLATAGSHEFKEIRMNIVSGLLSTVLGLTGGMPGLF